MAGPPKKKAVEVEDCSDDSSNEASESDSYHGQQEIQADFEGRNPEGQDFHGIKQLLHQLFLKAHINISEMSDLLIAQTGVGSVLKQSIYDEDDDDDDDDTTSDALDVFGITSVINLTKNKDSSCIQEFTELLKELSLKHASNEVQAEISNILSSKKKIGLLINERFVNIPAKISDPLLSSLQGELERIKKKETSYDFDYIIMICKLHKEKGKESEVLYANAEEEIFVKEAKTCFEFNVQDESDSTVAGKWAEGDVALIPFRKVIIFNGNKLPNIIQQVKAFVN